MKRDAGGAATARALLLPALAADPARLPPAFAYRSQRALRLGSVVLHEAGVPLPLDVSSTDSQWFRRLASREGLEAMLHLAGCAFYSRALRSYVGSPLVHALVERVGRAPVQELMRRGEGPDNLTAPATMVALRAAGGAVLLAHLQAHAPATAGHLVLRVTSDDIRDWHRSLRIDAGVRDALITSARQHLDSSEP